MINRIDIIISTRNRVNDLLYTVEIMKKNGFSEAQFYIIDDGSTDHTDILLPAKFPNVNFLRNEQAKGYIGNRNKLMSWSSRDFVLSLDDDSHIRSKEDIMDAIYVLESDSSYGIFGYHAFEQLEEPPIRTSLPDTIRKVRSYIGCGHIIKREVIRKLGAYREEFEFYCEELDYSLRAFQHGYFVVTNDQLVVHHRIDWILRQKQKVHEQATGVYGAIWRSTLGFSNHLIIRGLYYPYGWDIIYSVLYTIKRFYNFALLKNDYQGFFLGLKRWGNFIKFIRKNKSKLTYSSFKEWIKMPVC
jgi:GT2 family glycosyltransferase